MAIDTLCFIPCCSSKNAVGGVESPSYDWPGSGLELAWTRLVTARQGMEHCIEGGSSLTPALCLYSGGFYKAFDARLVKQLINLGKFRLFIISAGYGVLDAFEPAHKYEAKMEGKIAKYWRESGLADVICDICLSFNPNQVCGFFAGEPIRSGPGAKYRYFYTEGVKKALQNGFEPARAGCFYRESGRGVTAILGSLGRAFSSCLTSSLNCDEIIETAKAGCLRDGGIIIGYDDMVKG